MAHSHCFDMRGALLELWLDRFFQQTGNEHSQLSFSDKMLATPVGTLGRPNRPDGMQRFQSLADRTFAEV